MTANGKITWCMGKVVTRLDLVPSMSVIGNKIKCVEPALWSTPTALGTKDNSIIMNITAKAFIMTQMTTCGMASSSMVSLTPSLRNKQESRRERRTELKRVTKKYLCGSPISLRPSAGLINLITKSSWLNSLQLLNNAVNMSQTPILK